MRLTPADPDIRTIVDRINNNDIDLQPDFQRQEVWPRKKQKRLIDTVIRGWSIPPIHLVQTEQNSHEVLDGQQRLAALRDFLNNRFAIDGSITPEDPLVASLHGKFYKQLDIPMRRSIDQYPIRCFYITDHKPEEPSELFYRLNQPTMLTAGEQRNALFGPARAQLKELVSRFSYLGNNRDTIGFSNLRLAYDDVLARLLYFIETGNFGLKSTETRISERFRSQLPFNDFTFQRACRAIEFYSAGRKLTDNYRFNKASLLSWLIFFSRFSETAPPDELAIHKFSIASRSGVSSNSISDAIDLFSDRVSLRVTDVSSVVYRDFVLCYVYHFMAEGSLPSVVSAREIEQVASQMETDADKSFEENVERFVDVEEWSQRL